MSFCFFLGREVLDEAAAAIGVGVTTDEIDRIVHEASVDRECYPSPLNYYQFPKRYEHKKDFDSFILYLPRYCRI